MERGREVLEIQRPFRLREMLNPSLILDEALTLVSQMGIRRFSVSELAQRLGVVKSALYHHFPGGKWDIIRALFEREEEKVLSSMEASARKETTTRESLIALAKAQIEAVMELGRLYRVREDIADELEGFLVSRRRAFLQRERALIASILEQGVKKGEIKEVNVDLLSLALQGALHNLSRAYALRGEGLPLEEISELMEILFQGIGVTEIH